MKLSICGHTINIILFEISASVTFCVTTLRGIMCTAHHVYKIFEVVCNLYTPGNEMIFFRLLLLQLFLSIGLIFKILTMWRTKGGWKLEAALQHNHNSWIEENKARIARRHQHRGFLSDN